MEATVDGIIRRQFDVGPGAELSVNTIEGDVSVRADVVSTITIEVPGIDADEADELRIGVQGRQVSVRPRHSHSGGIDRIIATVPRDCRVFVRTANGDINVAGVQADIELESPSGDVTLDGIAGNCKVIAPSGDVTGRAAAGSLEVRASSGDIIIRESRLQSFRLDAPSGDVSVETSLTPSGTYYAAAVSGDIELLVPEGTGIDVDFSSQSGEVDCDLPVEVSKASRHHWEARINGGGPKFKARAVSGDLRIRQSTTLGAATQPMHIVEPASSYSQSPAPDSSTEDDRTLGVLGALERGEITIEDAMARLDELGQ